MAIFQILLNFFILSNELPFLETFRFQPFTFTHLLSLLLWIYPEYCHFSIFNRNFICSDFKGIGTMTQGKKMSYVKSTLWGRQFAILVWKIPSKCICNLYTKWILCSHLWHFLDSNYWIVIPLQVKKWSWVYTIAVHALSAHFHLILMPHNKMDKLPGPWATGILLGWHQHLPPVLRAWPWRLWTEWVCVYLVKIYSQCWIKISFILWHWSVSCYYVKSHHTGRQQWCSLLQLYISIGRN